MGFFGFGLSDLFEEGFFFLVGVDGGVFVAGLDGGRGTFGGIIMGSWVGFGSMLLIVINILAPGAHDFIRMARMGKCLSEDK